METKKTNMEPKDLINYSGVSKHLTGNRSSIRSNYIPKKYKHYVEELEQYIKRWIDNLDKL